MGIFKLEPAFKDYIWGGPRLRDEYGKNCDYEKVAESWELSCHKDGASVISGGEFDGLTLQEYIDKVGRQVLGTNCGKFESFPILIKLIDAKDNLSVQVHPDNDYAQRVEGEYGKTEMWYVVDCDEGAELLYGFKHEISKEEFAQRIADNTLLEVTSNVPVNKGDVFFIDEMAEHHHGRESHLELFARPEVREDERFGAAHAAVKVDGGYHRLEGVGGEGVFFTDAPGLAAAE